MSEGCHQNKEPGNGNWIVVERVEDFCLEQFSSFIVLYQFIEAGL